MVVVFFGVVYLCGVFVVGVGWKKDVSCGVWIGVWVCVMVMCVMKGEIVVVKFKGVSVVVVGDDVDVNDVVV